MRSCFHLFSRWNITILSHLFILFGVFVFEHLLIGLVKIRDTSQKLFLECLRKLMSANMVIPSVQRWVLLIPSIELSKFLLKFIGRWRPHFFLLTQ